MTAMKTKTQEEVKFDFEISRDLAPRYWGWHYIKPLNQRATDFLMEGFDPEFHYWDEERQALQVDQRDAEEWLEIIDENGFQGNWIREEVEA